MLGLDSGTTNSAKVGDKEDNMSEKQYTLTASNGNRKSHVSIVADDDNEAVWEALWIILSKAHKYSDNGLLWARGLIVLSDNEGNEIKRMAEKV
jgi:hypothetical protein